MSGGTLQIWLILRGLGLGLTNTALQTVALSAVSNKAVARASSLVNVMRMVFSAVGVAVLTTYPEPASYVIRSNGKARATGSTTNRRSGDVCGNCGNAGRGPEELCDPTRHSHGAQRHLLARTDWMRSLMLIALVLGRDPALEAIKKARANGKSASRGPHGNWRVKHQ